MNMQELITAVHYKLPIKFVVINNSFLGMVRQWQELFHGKKYSFTDLSESNPDFVKLAEALGLKAFSTDSIDEVDLVLEKAMEYNDGPVFIEFKVEKDGLVFPMVPGGASIKDMIVGKFETREG